MENKYPLILVFYLDVEMMKIKDIIQPFAQSVNDMLAAKDANAMAFFLPTKGEERVECINPSIIAEADMEKINQMIEDIKEQFSVGVDMDIEDVELENKPCKCGGNCKCNDNE